MNLQQRVFYRQAFSDWETFQYLRRRRQRIECHELHYLQMATEKLAKAYLWGTKTPPRQVHASFIQFLRRAATDARIRQSMNLAQQNHFEEWIRSALPLARAVEMLAPDLARNGPNPEYPWPRAMPAVAPVDHDFAISSELDAVRGRKLMDLISKLFSTFEQWAYDFTPIEGRSPLIAVNPYQPPEERPGQDDRAAQGAESRFGVVRVLIGVWSPFSIATAARRSSTIAAFVASSVTLSLYIGVAEGVIIGCGGEPFRGCADCLSSIGIMGAVVTASFIAPCLLAESVLLGAWRLAGANEYYLRVMLIWPPAFRLPYVLLCIALFLEIAREPSFEFMEIEKPFLISYEYAARFANAAIALGSTFAVMLAALPIRRLFR